MKAHVGVDSRTKLVRTMATRGISHSSRPATALRL
jgi:hypothetical protein